MAEAEIFNVRDDRLAFVRAKFKCGDLVVKRGRVVAARGELVVTHYTCPNCGLHWSDSLFDMFGFVCRCGWVVLDKWEDDVAREAACLEVCARHGVKACRGESGWNTILRQKDEAHGEEDPPDGCTCLGCTSDRESDDLTRVKRKRGLNAADYKRLALPRGYAFTKCAGRVLVWCNWKRYVADYDW